MVKPREPVREWSLYERQESHLAASFRTDTHTKMFMKQLSYSPPLLQPKQKHRERMMAFELVEAMFITAFNVKPSNVKVEADTMQRKRFSNLLMKVKALGYIQSQDHYAEFRGEIHDFV